MRLNPELVQIRRIENNVSKMSICRETGLIIPVYEKIESKEIPEVDENVAATIARMIGASVSELQM